MIDTIQVCQDFIQGDGFVIKVSYNPVPVGGLVGSTFELTIKSNEAGTSALSVVYVTPITEPEHANALLGIVNIPIPAAKTAVVQPGEYFGSLKATLSGGEPKTLIRTGKDNARKVECFSNLKSS